MIETGGGNAVDAYVNGHQQNTTGSAGFHAAGNSFEHTAAFQQSVYQGAVSVGIPQQAHENKDDFTNTYNQAFIDSRSLGKDLVDDAKCRTGG